MDRTAVWICACLCLCGSLARGQDGLAAGQDGPPPGGERVVNFGLKGGFTSSLYMISQFEVGGVYVGDVQNNYKLGYFGSVFMRINFGRHFLQPEISYHVSRGDVAFAKPLPPGSPPGAEGGDASISTEIRSVDMPVIYGYNIVKQGPYSLGVFGGPKVRYILPGGGKVVFLNFDQQDIREALRRLNVCATLGVAVTISRVFFDCRYDIGLRNLSKSITCAGGEDGGGVSFKRRDCALSFSFGVFF